MISHLNTKQKPKNEKKLSKSKVISVADQDDKNIFIFNGLVNLASCTAPITGKCKHSNIYTPFYVIST